MTLQGQNAAENSLSLRILEFSNPGGEQSRLGREWARATALHFARNPRYRVLGPAGGEPPPAAPEGEEAAALSRAAGADLVVFGSLSRSGRRIRITTRMLSVSTGRLLLNRTVELSGGDYLRLYEELLPPAAETAPDLIPASVPPPIPDSPPPPLNPPAAEEEAETLEKLDLLFSQEGLFGDLP